MRANDDPDAAILLAAATLGAQARPQPVTKLPLDQVSAQMFHVSAGKRLKPAAWPNGARVAVGLSFDVDNATADLATGNLISESISRGEYGAVDGLPRILRLLDKHQVPASFFIPAVSHLLHPQMIPSILAAGRHQMALTTMAGICGGNVRVGLEDSIYVAKGRLAHSNAEQVAKIRRILEDLSFEIATPEEARTRLALKGAAAVAF